MVVGEVVLAGKNINLRIQTLIYIIRQECHVFLVANEILMKLGDDFVEYFSSHPS